MGIKILDCTIRDGGYINNWFFDKKLVREVYRAVSKSGVDFMEIGFRGTEKYFDSNKYGLWRFSKETDIREAVDGIKGAKIALMGDYGKIDLSDFDDKRNSVVDMVRIAVHKNDVCDAVALLEKLKGKGYITSLQAMGFSGYTKQERDQIKKVLKISNIDYFYIADSYGSFFPDQIRELFEPFLELPNVKIGFHPHNSLQMAFANALEVMKCGVSIIDCSIFGMGRGAGNLPLESIVSYLQFKNVDKYNVVPILNCIDEYFVKLHKENPWGYQLPYLISGIFKCHPYYTSSLIDRKEYSIGDIWKAMEIIEKINPIGFKKEIVDNLIKKGIIGSPKVNAMIQRADLNQVEDEEEKVYKVPYKGRHSDRIFLVLANGPNLKRYKVQIDTFIKKYDPIILGANHLSGLFVPHYHAFNNKRRFSMYVDEVNADSKLLIGQNIPETMILEYTDRDYEPLFFKDVLDNDFDIKNGVIQANCRTISVLLTGVAIVMGAEQIFVVGMDGYIGPNKETISLFYKEQMEPEDTTLIVERHNWNEKFLYQIDAYLKNMGKEGIHILTPTSHNTFYKGIHNYI